MANDVEIRVRTEGASSAAGDIDSVRTSVTRLDRAVGDGGRSFGGYGTGLGGIGDRADEVDTRMMGLSDGIQGVGDLMRGDLAPHEYAMALSDIGSSIYNFVVPSITSAITAIRNFSFSTITSAAQVVASWVMMGIQSMINAAKMAAAWLIGLGPIGLVILAIGAIIAILVALGVSFDDVKRFAQNVWNWIAKNWPLLLAILTGPFGIAVLVIKRNWDTIKAGATAVKDWIGARLSDVVGFFTGMPGRISSATSGMFRGITNAFKSAINALIDIWNNFSITFGGYDIPGPGPNIPSFTISTPNIGHVATGGVRTGLNQVAERGRELVDFGAAGGRVRSNPDTELALAGAGAGGLTVVVNVAGSIVSENDIKRIIRDEAARGGFRGAF